jgi:hypothetical protein
MILKLIPILQELQLDGTIIKVNLTMGTKIYLDGFNQVNNDLKTERNRNFTNLAPQANIRIILKPNSGIIHAAIWAKLFTNRQINCNPFEKSSNPLFVQIGQPESFTRLSS